MSPMRRAPRRDRGFTLMELMVTMAIAASLMGMGAGLFLSMGRRTAADNALAAVSSLIVNVRNASSRFPAMIVVNPSTDSFPGSVQAMAQEVRQELHFDPRKFEGQPAPMTEMGIEGRECELMGNTVDPTGGRVGGGVRLGGGKIDCRAYAAYDVTDGLTIELWMKPDSASAADLVTKGDAIRVKLEGGSRLSVQLQVADEHGAEKVGLAATIPPVRPYQWLGVRVSYDRTAITISTDTGFGWIQRGHKDEIRRLAPAPDASLMVGGFSGMLDDFRFAGVHSTEPLAMPTGVKLVGAKVYAIYFNGGRLDPTMHPGVARIATESAGRRTTLEIAQNGMLSVAYTDAAVEAAPSPTDQPKGPAKKE